MAVEPGRIKPRHKPLLQNSQQVLPEALSPLEGGTMTPDFGRVAYPLLLVLIAIISSAIAAAFSPFLAAAAVPFVFGAGWDSKCFTKLGHRIFEGIFGVILLSTARGMFIHIQVWGMRMSGFVFNCFTATALTAAAFLTVFSAGRQTRRFVLERLRNSL